MANLPDMTKHRGFPSGMPGTGVQFTIRRANPRGVTPIKALPRKARPGTAEHVELVRLGGPHRRPSLRG